MNQNILPGINLNVDFATNLASLKIGEVLISFEWNNDAELIFADLENACPIELLSVIGQIEQYTNI